MVPTVATSQFDSLPRGGTASRPYTGRVAVSWPKISSRYERNTRRPGLHREGAVAAGPLPEGPKLNGDMLRLALPGGTCWSCWAGDETAVSADIELGWYDDSMVWQQTDWAGDYQDGTGRWTLQPKTAPGRGELAAEAERRGLVAAAARAMGELPPDLLWEWSGYRFLPSR